MLTVPSPIPLVTSSGGKACAFEVDVEELKSPSTPKMHTKMETLSQTPTRRLSLEKISERIESADKKKRELQLNKAAKARHDLDKYVGRVSKVCDHDEEEREHLRQKILQELEMADEKKLQSLEEKAAKAGFTVSKALGIMMTKKSMEMDEVSWKRQVISEALEHAEELHNKFIQDKQMRANEINEHAKEMYYTSAEQKRLHEQQSLEELTDSLLLAEAKKTEFLHERALKAGSAYYRAKQIANCMRDVERIESRRLSRELENELRSAQLLREDLDRQRKEKLLEHSKHVEQVRERRRSSIGPLINGSPGLEQSPSTDSSDSVRNTEANGIDDHFVSI